MQSAEAAVSCGSGAPRAGHRALKARIDLELYLLPFDERLRFLPPFRFDEQQTDCIDATCAASLEARCALFFIRNNSCTNFPPPLAPSGASARSIAAPTHRQPHRPRHGRRTTSIGAATPTHDSRNASEAHTHGPGLILLCHQRRVMQAADAAVGVSRAPLAPVIASEDAT